MARLWLMQNINRWRSNQFQLPFYLRFGQFDTRGFWVCVYIAGMSQVGVGQGGQLPPPRFWWIKRCRRAAAVHRITTCPPGFLDFATCLHSKNVVMSLNCPNMSWVTFSQLLWPESAEWSQNLILCWAILFHPWPTYLSDILICQSEVHKSYLSKMYKNRICLGYLNVAYVKAQ